MTILSLQILLYSGNLKSKENSTFPFDALFSNEYTCKAVRVVCTLLCGLGFFSGLA